MNYKKYEYEDYTIHFFKTDKFKSIMVSLILINEFDKISLTKNALLRRLLTGSSKNYKNETEVIKKIYSLYNSGVYIENSFQNNVVSTDISIEFLEDKYTEEGMLKKTLDYYFDVIFNPNVINNEFEHKNFCIAKKSLLNYYDREIEEKNSYAQLQAYELLREEYLRYPINGYKEFLNDISEKDMYDFYKKIFKTACSNIFVIGNFNEKEMLDIINKNVKGKLFKNKNKYISNNFNKLDKLIEKTDKENNNQSKLVMIYKPINITERERNDVFPVFNRIFGLGNNSKLFRNVRENKSLAYDIRSSFNRNDCLITVLAGISSENKEETINAVKEELDNIEKGNFSDNDLKDAILSRKRIIKECMDEISSVFYSEIDHILCGNDRIDDKLKKSDTVTKNEIVLLANKLNLSVIYMLEGEKNEKN